MDDKDNQRLDIRDFFLIALMSLLFGIFNFTWDVWIFLKIPLLASGLTAIHAAGLYFVRK